MSSSHYFFTNCWILEIHQVQQRIDLGLGSDQMISSIVVSDVGVVLGAITVSGCGVIFQYNPQ